MRSARPIIGQISVADFDPNRSLGSASFWMVYDGTISLRRTRGPAITDFGHAREAKLYEWDPSVPGWALVAHKGPHDPFCDQCGLTTFEYPRRWNYATDCWDTDTNSPQKNCGKWVIIRRNGRIVDPLRCVFACQTCREKM